MHRLIKVFKNTVFWPNCFQLTQFTLIGAQEIAEKEDRVLKERNIYVTLYTIILNG